MKYLFSLVVELGAALVAAQAAPDIHAPLTKPTLVDSIDYLEAGLRDHMPQTRFTATEWTNDQIPSDCAYEAQENQKSPSEFRVFDVTYDDCPAQPWVLCYHTASEISIDSLAGQFGRVPLGMREYIRHVVTIPATGGSAYNRGGNVVFFRPVDDMIRVFMHEVGHSLDADAYVDGGLSSSADWWANYDGDARAIDGYGANNMVEEVAQAHVLAVYNENVPGKYAGIEPGAAAVFRQYATVITQAREAKGRAKTLLTPGLADGDVCRHLKETSKPVPKSGAAASKRWGRVERRQQKGNCTLSF